MDNEVKQANRKALPKFLLILLASAFFGGMSHLARQSVGLLPGGHSGLQSRV